MLSCLYFTFCLAKEFRPFNLYLTFCPTFLKSMFGLWNNFHLATSYLFSGGLPLNISLISHSNSIVLILHKERALFYPHTLKLQHSFYCDYADNICLFGFSKGAPSSNRKRRAWSESDEEDDRPSEQNPNSSPAGYKENSAGSDEEARGDEGSRRNRETGDEEEDDD